MSALKVTLVAMDETIICQGVRSLSACLKQQGFDVSIVFARCVIGEPMPAAIAEQIGELCQGSGVVGVSLMSNHFPQSVDLTKRLKSRLNVPIVWGGIHPTFRPDDCLQHADGVCVGEGEESLLDMCVRLRDGRDFGDTPGFHFRTEDGIRRNAQQPLVADLDSLPDPDLDVQGHFIRDGRRMVALTASLLCHYLPKRRDPDGKDLPEYYIAASRGCPFRCSYCASNSIRHLYPGQKFFRLRSIGRVVNEVEGLISRYPFIRSIYFADDDFFVGPIERAEEFRDAWKRRIGLLFVCTSSPQAYDEKKMGLFMDAGLGIISMGIQSVSENASRVFHRPVSKDGLRRAIRSIHSFQPPLPPGYDFITDNPYETDADRLENLRFCLDMPRPFDVHLFSLVPFPGTELYDRMKSEGRLRDEHEQIYMKNYSRPANNYTNLIFFLMNHNVPVPLLRAMISRPLWGLFNSGPARRMLAAIPYAASRRAASAVLGAIFPRGRARRAAHEELTQTACGEGKAHETSSG